MAIETLICEGLLKNNIAGIFLICNDAANAGRSPATTFLGGNLFIIEFSCDGVCTFPGKQIREDSLYDFCLFRIDLYIAIFPAVPVRRISELVGPIFKALFD